MPNATNNQHLHVGDYGYYINALGEEVPAYICYYAPDKQYFYVANRYNHCCVATTETFKYKGHLLNDLHLAHTDYFASYEPLTRGGMFYIVKIGTESISSPNINDIYHFIFKAMAPKLEALQPHFHHIDDSLFNGYVRLTPDSNPSGLFDHSFNYPIINGALFNSADEVEYDRIISIEDLNECESDNGTGRYWVRACSLDEGLKKAREQKKNTPQKENKCSDCHCEECDCGDCE